MEKKEIKRCEKWQYTCRTSKGLYTSKEYDTRDELAAVISELIRRTPQRFTNITVIRRDYYV